MEDTIRRHIRKARDVLGKNWTGSSTIPSASLYPHQWNWDPRIHFAPVCGSRSCAPISYYSPESIDRELEAAARNFINSSEVIVIPEEGKVMISQMFRWYEPDFGGLPGVLKFIGRYLVDDDKKRFLETKQGETAVDYLYYDWHLNA